MGSRKKSSFTKLEQKCYSFYFYYSIQTKKVKTVHMPMLFLLNLLLLSMPICRKRTFTHWLQGHPWVHSQAQWMQQWGEQQQQHHQQEEQLIHTQDIESNTVDNTVVDTVDSPGVDQVDQVDQVGQVAVHSIERSMQQQQLDRLLDLRLC